MLRPQRRFEVRKSKRPNPNGIRHVSKRQQLTGQIRFCSCCFGMLLHPALSVDRNGAFEQPNRLPRFAYQGERIQANCGLSTIPAALRFFLFHCLRVHGRGA